MVVTPQLSLSLVNGELSAFRLDLYLLGLAIFGLLLFGLFVLVSQLARLSLLRSPWLLPFLFVVRAWFFYLLYLVFGFLEEKSLFTTSSSELIWVVLVELGW